MAAKGFKELVLIPALTEQDFSGREARAVIDAVFSSIKDALLRHEPVELPIGSFTVVHSSEKRAWRFGKVIDLLQHKVIFQPSAELELAAAAAPPSPPRPKRPSRKKEKSASEMTQFAGALIAEFVRGNVYSCDWKLFFEELRNGPSIRATFQYTRPQPHEFRPLNEAAQVIEKCAPKKMPEDSWDHLYACLEWFALWSQRVIPQTIWQEALQEAKNILLPGSLK